MNNHVQSEEENEELKEYKAKYNHENWSTDKINKELLWHWFHCFKENQVFETYCQAKRSKETAVCKKLEEEYERIGELYDDWGDIYALPSMHDSEGDNWEKWLAEKSHLFFESPVTLHSNSVKQIPGTDLLISIPSKASKNKLQKLLKDFLDLHEDLIDKPIKYPLNVIHAESNATTLRRLGQAYLVIEMLSLTEDGYSEDHIWTFSHAEIALQILRTPLLRHEFGWKNDAEYNAKGEVLISTDDVILSHKSKIIDLMKFRRLCVENTIHGHFPSKLSKIKSAQKNKG